MATVFERGLLRKLRLVSLLLMGHTKMSIMGFSKVSSGAYRAERPGDGRGKIVVTEGPPGIEPMMKRVKTVRSYPARKVTTIGSEARAESLGMQTSDIEAIWKTIETLYKTRLHPAIGLCIRRHGDVVLNRTIGHASGNAPDDPLDKPKELATPDTLFNLFSASKSVTAMLVHLLDQRGQLHLDDPIVDYIPEFGQGSKKHITIRHLLTHRAGIPNVSTKNRNPLDLLTDQPAIIQLLCESRPTLRPGRNLAYHALSGGFILAEIVERVTGTSLRDFLDKEIREPLGFEHLTFGVKPEDVPRIAEHAYTGPPPLQPYGWLLERSLGVDIREAVRLSNEHKFLTSCVPSGNIIATTAETTRFFELLLRGGTLDNVRIFEPRTIRRAVAETSYLEIDTTLMLPVRYGMGFMLGGQYLSFYGPDTPKAFGHLGFTNVLAYADPERDITVSLMTTGKPFVTLKLLYWLNVMRVIAARTPRTAGRGTI